jgi:SRSO17 transposase
VEAPRLRRRRQGPRLYDWAVASLPNTADGYGHRLLIRRSITNPTDLAYYLCFGLADTDDEILIRTAGTRWAIEECFKTAKTEIGLDNYQVRRHDA